MGIWIRSQDGCVLCNANTIWIEDEGVLANKGSIPTWLGEYACEAEAMQVLDMIQERIVHQEQVRLMPSQDWITPSIVFQMPPAGFSQPSKEPAANMEKDLDLYKEALIILLDSMEKDLDLYKEALIMLLDSNDYITCDNCPLRDGCSRREATAICISDLRDYFLEEARDSIARAEGGR